MNQHDENIAVMKDLKNRLDAVLNKEDSDVDYRQPDPLKHKYISFIKSAFRIVAGMSLVYGAVWYAGILLIIAEFLGVVEELV